MKILFVLEHYYPYVGGVEVLFKTICEGLVKQGHKVQVVTSRLPDTKQKETVNGVNITRISVPKGIERFVFTFAALPYLLKIGKKYDLIHTTTYNGAPPAWLVSKFLRKPCIITVHEIVGKDWANWNLTGFSAKILQLAEKTIVALGFDKYVCVSKSTQHNLLKIGVQRKKSCVIHNAVDYDTFDPKKYKGARKEIRDKLGLKDEFVYLFYGRPGKSKGPEYLINAIPNISKLIPNSKAVLIMADKPADRYAEMKSLVKKVAENNVILHKSVPYKELPKYLLAADNVVIPSITEGFGFCVAESCALGIPVVASNTTSIPEVVSGKYVLVPTRNSNAISQAVKLIKDKKYMKTPLKKFTVESCVEGYIDLYKRLLR